MDGINQIHVNPTIGLTFAAGIRHIVRQDPDVIMIGEIRDRETADIAIRSALTGHFVYSTLHTNDAPSAVTRLTDMGVENYLITSSVVAVLAQRLVRLICANCKERRGLSMNPFGERAETFRGTRLRSLQRLRLQRARRHLRTDGAERRAAPDDHDERRRREAHRNRAPPGHAQPEGRWLGEGAPGLTTASEVTRVTQEF